MRARLTLFRLGKPARAAVVACRFSRIAAMVMCLTLPSHLGAATWGADSQPTRTTASHGRRVMGYLPQWDAWKGVTAGLPAQGYLNHLNVDYSQYTHLNFSFFGVANDGSLHSGDYRNQNIWQAGAEQSPAPLLNGDIYSSWDYWLLFGELIPQWDFSNPATTTAGFVSSGNGWSNTVTGLTGPMPVPLASTNGAPGLLALAHSRGVKVLASIGGWSMCKHFPATAADPVRRARLVADCQRLIALGFDGIDFDWEYPGPFAGMNFTGSAVDYGNYLTLLQEVRAAIGTQRQLTLCLSASPAKLNGFDWPALAATVDSLNLMTYDFNGGWSGIAGHNAPLYPYPGQEGGGGSCAQSVSDLVARGVPRSKIAMGIGFYGRGVICAGGAGLNAPTLKTSAFVQPDGPIQTCADFATWQAFDGVPYYSYLRTLTNGWTRYWDTAAAVPCRVKGTSFLSYDDARSVGLKAEYARQQDLGGVIVWNVFGDVVPGLVINPGAKMPRSLTNDAPLVNTLNAVLAGDPVPADGTEGPGPGGTNAVFWPERLFAPFVDFTAWPLYDLVGAATNTGVRHAMLGFVVADPSLNAATAPATNLPAWGGYTAYAAAAGFRRAELEAFRALGGDFIISFGGAAGTELAVAVTDTNRLKAAYQVVIDTYGAQWLDFDIEGAWVADAASLLRRSRVLAALQADAAAAGRELAISLTLPVLPTGLDNNGLGAVRSAVTNRVNLARVNVMAMDYGGSAAPNPAGRMGDYAISAGTNLFAQLKAIYQAAGIAKTDAQLWSLVGVTSMLGVNDVPAEVFDQAAARQLAGFAKSNSFGLLSFWSLNRDQPGASGIPQTAYEFTGLFQGYGSGGGTNSSQPGLAVADASVVEGNTGATSLVFNVSLVPAGTNTVTVAFTVAAGTAAAPGDFAPTNGLLTFNPGQTTASVVVLVRGDTEVEPDETVTLALTSPTHAVLTRGQATGTIRNDDTVPPGGGGGGECAVTSQWTITYNGAAFRATQTLTNPNTTNIVLRMFEFDAPYTAVDWIGAGGDINCVTPARSGAHFTVATGWPVEVEIPAGGTLQLIYQASPGGSPPAPANVKINGVLIGGCPPSAPRSLHLRRNGVDVALSWTGPRGATNAVQWRDPAGSAAGWVTVADVLLPAGAGELSTNWIHSGAVTSAPARLYRIRVP